MLWLSFLPHFLPPCSITHFVILQEYFLEAKSYLRPDRVKLSIWGERMFDYFDFPMPAKMC